MRVNAGWDGAVAAFVDAELEVDIEGVSIYLPFRTKLRCR
jgi:hypothetical protein